MAGKGAGIYSPSLRIRGQGTYRAPSAGQHKAMLKAEGIKYKGLTDKQIIAKAKKSGDLYKQTKKPKMSTAEKVAYGAAAGVGLESGADITGKIEKVIHKTKKILKKPKSDLGSDQNRRGYPHE